MGSTGKSSTLGKGRGQGKIRTSPGNLSHAGVPRGGSGGNAVPASAWTAPASPDAAKQPQPCQGRGKARTAFPVGEQPSSVSSQGHCLPSSLCCCPSFIPCGNSSFLPVPAPCPHSQLEPFPVGRKYQSRTPLPISAVPAPKDGSREGLGAQEGTLCQRQGALSPVALGAATHSRIGLVSHPVCEDRAWSFTPVSRQYWDERLLLHGFGIGPTQ